MMYQECITDWFIDDSIEDMGEEFTLGEDVSLTTEKREGKNDGIKKT